MILSDEQTIADYSKTGVWGNVTLDALFRRAAQQNPQRIALVDAPDRESWTSGAPRALTYAEAEQEIRALAGFFSAVGLEPDQIIGLQAPNTVDTVLTILAAMRAGLVVATFPLHWRHNEVLPALVSIDAKALITADRVETRVIAEDALAAASDNFNLKFVFGLGKQLPDGILEISQVINQAPEQFEEPRIHRPGQAANHIASLTWVTTPDGPAPVPRSHNHWVAAGLMPFLETRLEAGAKILLPYLLTGLSGWGAGLVPWLLCEGTLHLHHPLALHSLTDHARWIEADYLPVPGSLAPYLDEALQGWQTKILAAWNTSAMPPVEYVPLGDFYDLHVAEEYGMVCRLRGKSKTPQLFDKGPLAAPSASPHAPTLISLNSTVKTTEDETRNFLSLGGAMSPDVAYPTHKFSINFSENGFINTKIPLIESDHKICGFGRPEATAPGIAQLDSLDEVYGAFPEIKEAAAFLVDDEIVGQRLLVAVVPQSGHFVKVDAFYAYLDACRVSVAHYPHQILPVPSIPRTPNGAVARQQLAEKASALKSQKVA
ncbi:AMP-binding protein [Polycladidibacter hongkongensis]|uniref:AMP-binding protein n=1 Tax=Polycladidibacter hongkongensis TaxID=1647556 RepID=UPI00082F960A|nr:class I adenylate-forming enzyme family protein [Pseudovibrio hongkongensis]